MAGKKPEALNEITIVGAEEHNLKHITVAIPKNQLTVLTGVSGSGKSSLAFDTLYAEGQRRYVESLSSYARQFLGQMEKPHYEHIRGLAPTISIEHVGILLRPVTLSQKARKRKELAPYLCTISISSDLFL